MRFGGLRKGVSRLPIIRRDFDLVVSFARYRYQLEAFVDQVRGRTPHAWMTEEDSVQQMKAVEMVYEKVGFYLFSSVVCG